MPPPPPQWQPQQPPPAPGWQPPPPPGWASHQPPYGGPPVYGYPRPRDTNGFAIASLVCSLVGIILLVLGPVLGIVFGIVGLRQIPRLGQSGRGLAIAGITIGGIVLLFDVIGIIAAVATGSPGTGPGVSV